MASEEGNANTLKRHVVELLFQNPQGIWFEDFSGAFHQLHGYHPRIALHGYHTLKNLVADMENVVVVEGNSQQQVMKIAKGFRLDRWLEGEKGNELETSEKEVENLRDEDQVGDKTTLSDVLDLLISLLRNYKSGLRISYVQKFMLSRHAVDMEKFSIAHGYRNIIEFLEYELSGLIIRYQEKTCEYVVQIPEGLFDSDVSLDSDFSTWSSQSSTQDLTRTNSASSLYCTSRNDPNHVKEPTKHVPDLLAASKLIQGVLKCFPFGMKVCKLKRLLRKKHGFDLETFRSQQGYQDVLSCLKDIPELLLLNTNKHRNCLIHLQLRPFGSDLSLDSDFSGCSSHSRPPGLTRTHSVLSLDGTSSCTPSLDTSLSAGHTNSEPAKPMLTNSAVSLPSTNVSVPNDEKEHTKQALALPEVLALVNDLLSKYESGLRMKKIQEFLMATNSFDLEKFSITQGYKDSLEFLQRHMHHLSYMKRNQRFNCVVKLGKKAKKKQSQSHPQNGTTKKNPSVAPVPALMNGPVPQSTKPLEPAYSESGKKAKKKQSQSYPQTGTTKKNPSVAPVPALMNGPVSQSTKPLDPAYSESVLSLDGTPSCTPSLVTSLSAGHTNAQPEKPATMNSAASLPSTGVSVLNHVKEPTNQALGNISKPSDTPHDFSASKSQFQSLSFLDSSIPQEIKNIINSSMHIQLPLFHEVRSASPAKPNNPRQSISNGPPQKLNVSRFGGPPPAEEVPSQLNRQLASKSNMTKDEPSKDQDDLKQQVAYILTMHPDGMSLFQFRAAYSATYQRHFPMGHAASAKQRLQEMSDVVCMKSYGVQTRLLPVSSAMSSPKSDQPVTTTMEIAPVVPGLSQPRTVSLTQENSKDLGDDNKEDYPFLAPLHHQIAKPRASVQEEVKKNPKPMIAPVIPQSPVVCHTYAQVTASRKPLKPNSLHSKPTHLNSPCISANRASVPSQSNNPCISASRASVPSQSNNPCISAHSSSVPSHSNNPCISVHSSSVPSHANNPCISAHSSSVPSHSNNPCISVHSSSVPSQSNNPCISAHSSSVPSHSNNPCISAHSSSVLSHSNIPCISAHSSSVPSHPNDPCISAKRASVPSHPNNPCISANRASVPSHPNDPCISANSTSLPSTFHLASYNSGQWAQPVSYLSVPYVPQMPEISPINLAYNQVSRYPSRIQFQNPTVQSSPFAQPPHVRPIRYHPTTYHTQSIEQWSKIYTLPQVAAYSQMQKSSGVVQIALSPTFLTGGYPVSPPSRNMSQTAQQLECYNHTQQDGLQHSSVVVMKKSFTVTSLDIEPKPPASAYQAQYIDCNSLASTANTAPFISQGAWCTSQSFQPLETSSSSKRNPNALLLEPPVFMDRQQSVSASATITTSSYSPPSLVNATVSPYDKHLSLSSNSSNSAAQASEPRASINQQQCASLNISGITSNRKQAVSSPCPQDLSIRPSRQLSITPLRVCTDYEPPDQANPVVSFSKHVDDHHVSLPKNQTSYSPPNSPLKKPDRCVIL